MACNCGKDAEVKLLYACSGAADLGELADQVARKLKRDGFGSGTCLSGVGAGLSGYLESAKSSTRNIVIDGCPVGCGKRIFENHKLPFDHVVLTNFGLEKGKTPVSPELVATTAARVVETLNAKLA